MKKLIAAFIFLGLISTPSQARIHAHLVTTPKTVTLAATPEPAIASEKFTNSGSIQSNSSNTASMFVGPCSGTQDIELPVGSAVELSEFRHNNQEIPIDLNEICLKVGVDGEGAKVIYYDVVDH